MLTGDCIFYRLSGAGDHAGVTERGRERCEQGLSKLGENKLRQRVNDLRRFVCDCQFWPREGDGVGTCLKQPDRTTLGCCLIGCQEVKSWCTPELLYT